MGTYESEMLSFGYVASLHIDHPTARLDDVSERLGIAARTTHHAGDPRRSQNGTPQPGTYESDHWCCDLPTEDQQTITDFLARLVSELKPNRNLLREICDTGGELVVFIGVGSSRCCAHQFNRQLLADLSDIGLEMRLDFYGHELPQTNLHPPCENRA